MHINYSGIEGRSHHPAEEVPQADRQDGRPASCITRLYIHCDWCICSIHLAIVFLSILRYTSTKTAANHLRTSFRGSVQPCPQPDHDNLAKHSNPDGFDRKVWQLCLVCLVDGPQ